MRLWSLHPKYLDAKGLLAVWREGLLAKKAIAGRTGGYRNHPQLIRFRNCKNPAYAINAYLFEIYKEAQRRKYSFDSRKIKKQGARGIIPVPSGQMKFEFRHLLKKLKQRDRGAFEKLKKVRRIKTNPVFRITCGRMASWEKRQRRRPPAGRFL